MKIYDIEMNLEIVVGKDLAVRAAEICVGGYTMIFGGKEIYFDFDSFNVDTLEPLSALDEDDPRATLDIDCWNLDRTDFKELLDMSLDDFASLDRVDEVFISLGTDDPVETTISPYIFSLTFFLYVEDEKGEKRRVEMTYREESKEGIFDTTKFW